MCCRIAVELVLWLFYSTFDCHSTAFVLLILQPILHMLIPQPFNCSFYDQFHNNCTAYSKTNSTATQRTFYSYYTAILELILLPSYMSFYCTFYCLFLINSTAILQLMSFYCQSTAIVQFHSHSTAHFTATLHIILTAHSTAYSPNNIIQLILLLFYSHSITFLQKYLRIILYTAILLPFYCHSTAILPLFYKHLITNSTAILQPFHSHFTAIPQLILLPLYMSFYCPFFHNQFYGYSTAHSTAFVHTSYSTTNSTATAHSTAILQQWYTAHFTTNSTAIEWHVVTIS